MPALNGCRANLIAVRAVDIGGEDIAEDCWIKVKNRAATNERCGVGQKQLQLSGSSSWGAHISENGREASGCVGSLSRNREDYHQRKHLDTSATPGEAFRNAEKGNTRHISALEIHVD